MKAKQIFSDLPLETTARTVMALVQAERILRKNRDFWLHSNHRIVCKPSIIDPAPVQHKSINEVV